MGEKTHHQKDNKDESHKSNATQYNLLISAHFLYYIRYGGKKLLCLAMSEHYRIFGISQDEKNMGQKLGQHFLRNRPMLRKIAEALEIQKGETIIEIGGGHGELTEELITRNKEQGTRNKIIVIEKDSKLAELLQQRFSEEKNLEVVEGDVRKILPSLVPGSLSHVPYKVIGNIPYYLTGFLLRMIGELPSPPNRTVLLMQKEVAERICVQPSDSHGMNKLAASVGFWATPSILLRVPRKAFNPPPKVDSAALLLTPLFPRRGKTKQYFKVVHALFSQPRKTIINNLAYSLSISKLELSARLRKIGINPHARPETLSIEKIQMLVSSYSNDV